MIGLVTLKLQPQQDVIQPVLNESFCTYKRSRLSRSGDVVAERLCGQCPYREAGEGDRTAAGQRYRCVWTACPDKK